ncbi:MAG TPA: GNAT family N-acetyltransferase [Jatrophihabitans sp.]
MPNLDIRVSRYDDPDAKRLIDEVQQEYVVRYGSPDASPVDPEQFADPDGVFLIGYDDGAPVAMGGWRRHGPEHPETAWAAPAAEIKRMYVTESARGLGYARAVLAQLEATAVVAGIRWLLLETGQRQPEAIALYRSAGYESVPAFGHYADAELSIHLGRRVSEESA